VIVTARYSLVVVAGPAAPGAPPVAVAKLARRSENNAGGASSRTPVSYDDRDRRVTPIDGKTSGRIPPGMKIVGVEINAVRAARTLGLEAPPCCETIISAVRRGVG
jgi:hypothetical protein